MVCRSARVRKLPVLISTGLGEPFIPQDLTALGPLETILIPLHPDSLSMALRRLLDASDTPPDFTTIPQPRNEFF